MKKTIPTTIAGTLFYIEEDAYTRLSSYLESVKAHFASFPDNAEIVKDIESRIAEKFIESNNAKTGEKIVTLETVEGIVLSMGNVEDFNDDNTEHDHTTDARPGSSTRQKKLFRNPDDVIIAGVASGIAAYFGIDPVLVRLAFVLVVLIGGSGILIYLILWLVMPMAKTRSEKLEMRGEAVTLESVSEIVKEKVGEVKKNHGTFRKIISFPFVALRVIFSVLFPFLRKVVGVLIGLFGAIGMFILSFVAVVTVFNINSPYVDFPLMQIGSHATVFLAFFSGFFALLIPLLFVLLLGIEITRRRRNIFKTGLVIPFAIIWAVAVIICGTAVTKLMPEYQNFINTNPLYAEKTVALPLSGFTGIQVENGTALSVTTGKEFGVSETGTDKTREEMSVEVKNGILTVSRKNDFKICIFCSQGSPKISVTMPQIDTLSASNASSIDGTVTSKKLAVTLSNGSKMNLDAHVNTLTLQMSNAAWAELMGTSTDTTLTLSNGAYIRASDFVIQNATIHGQNASVAEVNVEKTLNANLENGSYVTYTGNPTIQKVERNGSKLDKEKENDSREETATTTEEF